MGSRNRGAITLYQAFRYNLKHIPIKLHEDMINGYWVMAFTRIFV